MHIIVIAVLLAVLYPTAAFAQTCHGRADLTGDRPVQVGAEVYHSDIVTGKAVSLVGGNSSIFGKVQFRHDNYHGPISNNGTVLDLGGGFQLSANEDRRVIVCPEIALSRHFGSDTDTSTGTNFGISSKSLGGGASVGFRLGPGKVQVVPYAGVWVQRFWPDSNVVSSGNKTVPAMRFGGGLVFSQRVSLVPAIGVPFRKEDGETFYSLSLNFGFGE